MRQQNTGRLCYSTPRGTPLYRTTVIITFGILLWLLGSFTLALMPARTTFNVSDAVPASSPNFHTASSGTPVVPKRPDPPPFLRARPLSTLSPITPLPPYLNQEIAVLTAKDRLLYHGNSNLPEIALTFDDGPNPLYTPQVLSILQRYGVKATFFCLGRQARAYPTLVKQEYDAGHVIGNHTWTHPNMTTLSAPSITWQLTTTSNILERITGDRPSFFRPPYGAFNSATLTGANQLGLTTTIWNVDPRDWSLPGTAVIVARVLYQVQKGSIILMHDGGGNRSQTIAALPTIITALRQRGFQFVTLQQLVDHLPKTQTRHMPQIVSRQQI